MTTTTNSINTLYLPIEKALDNTFIPSLLQIEKRKMIPEIRNLAKLPVKDCWMALPDPTVAALANKNFKTSNSTHHIITSEKGTLGY